MDALRRATQYVQQLETRVRELEQLCLEKDAVLRRLMNEVPLTERKAARLGLTPSTTHAPTAMAAHTTVQWPANAVRQKFIDFFKSKGHVFWASSPCVPLNDPTLLFANSGMNQFKPLFLGQADPSTELSKLKRACNTQKCIRAGGKHNDLDDVGKDTYHHTFFEMLGNWSFGDYFKKEAIGWAWELLTVEFKMDPSRLYATYFEGNDRVPADFEAKAIWEKLLPASHVLPFGSKENFWEMGPTGPCGPCTEIHYDRIGGRDVAALVNKDDPNVIEIWNNVFIQYNRNDQGLLETLPSQHVDTGMGFERLVSVLQDKKSNYDTDVWSPIFRELEKRAHVHPYTGKVGKEDVDNVDTAYRIVADHLRTLSFAIADGCEPSNEGRGYVLRRILRRAVRYGLDTLKCDKLFFSSMVPVLAEHMGGTFPELKAKLPLIMEVLEGEEKEFGRTIENGRTYFAQTVKKLNDAGSKVVPGAEAFLMYSSLGFPVDLTEIMANEIGFTVDKAGFEQQMAEFQQLSKTARDDYLRKQMGGAEGIVPKLEAAQTDALEKMGVPPTVAEFGKLSPDALPAAKAALLAIYDPEARAFVDKAEAGRTYGLVLDRTSFYHEAGGQVADTGKLTTDDGKTGAVFDVVDVQGSKGFVVHAGVLRTGALAKGALMACLVDSEKRKKLAANHTTTHMMNFALREVLKRDTDQKGSLVTAEKLRFDFDAREPLSLEQLANVENVVRQEIAAQRPVYAQVVPLAVAKSIPSLRAVFGETYPDPVRVISVGAPVDALVSDPTNPEWRKSSIELCGGSHLANSKDAGGFVVLQEEGIAKGIRRITAVTGELAREAVQEAARLSTVVVAQCEAAPTGEANARANRKRAAWQGAQD